MTTFDEELSYAVDVLTKRFEEEEAGTMMDGIEKLSTTSLYSATFDDCQRIIDALDEDASELTKLQLKNRLSVARTIAQNDGRIVFEATDHYGPFGFLRGVSRIEAAIAKVMTRATDSTGSGIDEGEE